MIRDSQRTFIVTAVSLVTALASALSGTSASAHEWTTLASTEDGFSVEFPGAAQPVKIDLDPKSMVSARQWALDKGQSGYVLIAVQFKIPVNKSEFLDATVKGAKGQCEIREDKRGTIPGGVSTDVVVDKCPDGKVVKLRMSAFGPWLYQAIVAGSPGIEETPEAKRFLDSFKITQAAPAPGAPAPVAQGTPPAAPSPAAPGDWKTVNADAHGFSVEFPGTPEQANGKIDPASDVSDRRWSVTRGDSGWMVAAMQFKHKVSDEATLTRIVTGMKGQCEMTDERRLAYPGGFTAEFMLDKCADGMRMRARLYVQDDRLYQVLAIGSAAMENTGDTKRFFDSFKLTKTATAAAAPAPSAPAPAQTGKWGAIAIDTADLKDDDPSYGIGGGATEAEATKNALTFCKDEDGEACKVMVTYNACGAVAVSGTGRTGWGKGPTKKTAEAQAVAGCKHDACKVVASDCN